MGVAASPDRSFWAGACAPALTRPCRADRIRLAAEIIYLTEEGELRELPAQKDAGAAIANLGLVGWELVIVDPAMWYFKREKQAE